MPSQEPADFFFPYSIPPSSTSSSSSLPPFNPIQTAQISINDYTNTFSSSFAPPTIIRNPVNQPPPQTFPAVEDLSFMKQQLDPLPFRSPSNKSSSAILGDLANHDWEAVRYFLSSQVRPGGDVSRVYKCNFCSHEFPNAQAFGGHMSSHSKTKKTATRKKMKRPPKEAPGSACRNEKRLKTEKDPAKEKPVGEAEVEGDEEWFKYLNYDANDLPLL